MAFRRTRLDSAACNSRSSTTSDSVRKLKDEATPVRCPANLPSLWEWISSTRAHHSRVRRCETLAGRITAYAEVINNYRAPSRLPARRCATSLRFIVHHESSEASISGLGLIAGAVFWVKSIQGSESPRQHIAPRNIRKNIGKICAGICRLILLFPHNGNRKNPGKTD